MLSAEEYGGDEVAIHETAPHIAAHKRPTFQDLQAHAAGGRSTRLLGRYFFQPNPERSINRHRRMGTPILARSTRIIHRPSLLAKPNPLEAITDRIVFASTTQEEGHTLTGLTIIAIGAISVHKGVHPLVLAPVGCAVAWEDNLVAIIRYQRARAIRVATLLLQAGRTFGPDYTNGGGIDARAVANFYAAADGTPQAVNPAEPLRESTDQSDDVEAFDTYNT